MAMNQEVKQINNKKVKKQLSFFPYADFLDFFKRLCLHVHIDIVNSTFLGVVCSQAYTDIWICCENHVWFHLINSEYLMPSEQID